MAVERRGAAIEIAHLNKHYGSGPAAVVALDDINLRVAAGEFLGYHRGYFADAEILCILAHVENLS